VAGDQLSSNEIAGDGNSYYLKIVVTTGNGSDVKLRIDGFLVERKPASATPTLAVTPPSLTGLAYTVGSGPSAEQSFALTGADLNGMDVTVTAPASFEISKTSGSGFTTGSLTYAAYNGSSQTVYVRLASGLSANYYSGNVTISGGGDTDGEAVAVTGAAGIGPSITNIAHSPASPTSAQTVSVSADIADAADGIGGAELHWGTTSGSLTNTINMSQASGNTYTTDANIPAQTAGTTVYYEVYALDGEAVETTSAEQSYTVTGAATATITVSPSTINFDNVYAGGQSEPALYTVSATGLTGNLSIAAPTGFQVSTTCGSGYASSLALTPSAGTVSSTTIYARFAPGSTGSFSGSIAHSASGATTQNITVNETNTATNLPGSYYSTATGTGRALLNQLHQIVNGHTKRGYDDLWTDFQTTDKRPDGTVWDMYSDEVCSADPYEFTFITEQCGSYGIEGDCYNREHSFPKSWWGGSTDTMYTDLFHLVPTDGKVNGMRSSYEFGQVSSPTWTSRNGGKLGPNVYPGSSGAVAFEPVDEYKGDFARAYLYMATRYANKIDAWASSPMVDGDLADADGSSFEAWALEMLLAWHAADPVDQKERNRNDAIFLIQDNRNPFIDNPSYATQIWSATVNPEPSNHVTAFAATAASSTQINLSWTDATGTNLPDGYLVMANTTGTFTAPTDGTDPATDTILGDGSALIKVAHGAGATASFTGLTASTTYHFKIWPYANSSSTIDFKTDGTVPTASATTPAAPLACATDLIISQVSENAASKFVEIANYTGAAVSLANYNLVFYANGGTSVSYTIDLTDASSIPDQDVWVLGAAALAGVTDQVSASLQINGNDVVALRKSGANIDVFGTIGTSADWYADQSAIRNEAITAATTTYTASEWTFSAYAGGSTPWLGSHTMTCSSNDRDSKVDGPALGSQPNPGTVSSLADTQAEQVRVFDFTIRDYGTADGLATKVTQVVIKAGASNTANWTTQLAGARLSLDGGTSFVTTGTPVITASQISFPIAAGNLDIADGGTATASLFVHLPSTGLTDGGVLHFQIPATSHGFTADAAGSQFATSFGAATASNTIAIAVVATELRFVQQPTSTATNTAMSPSPTVQATDANGNRDLGFAGAVSLTSSGTLTGSPLSATASSGLATFAGVTHTATGTGLQLTAAASGLTSATSGTFAITLQPKIVITEAAGAGIAGDANDEYIELSNLSGFDVDLTGWKLKYYESALEATLTLTGTLADNDAYVIAVRTTHTAALVPDFVPGSSFSINNNFYIVLENASVVVMDQAGTSGSKFTDTKNYEFTNCSADNQPVANWVDLGSGNGTPGVMNCCLDPTQVATGLNFTGTTDLATTLNWTNGNGTNRIVVAKLGSAVDWSPVDGQTYAANASFGSGTERGTGNFVVFNGTGSSVAVTSLVPATTYHFAVFEYKCTEYMATAATANVTTLAAVPEINLKWGVTSYASGETFDFGAVAWGSSADRTFTIENTGSGPMTLTLPLATTGNYAVTSAPAGTIASGGTTSFTVRFTPGGVGAETGSLSITSDDADENPYLLDFAGTGGPSALSDVVAEPASEQSTISSVENDPAPLASTDGVQVWQIRLRDGGASLNDADNLPTIFTGFTLAQDPGNSADAWAAAIKTAALFDGGTLAGSATVSANQLVFTGLSISVPDGGQKVLSLRLSLNASLGSNAEGEDFVFSLSNANTSTLANGTSSRCDTFAAASSTNGMNALDVVATELRFVQQPTDYAQDEAMNPAPTVQATDAGGNRDLGFTSAVSLTSSGTLTGSPLSANASSGLATFSSVTHTAEGTGLVLTASSAGLADATSASFEITSITLFDYGDLVIVAVNTAATAGDEISFVCFVDVKPNTSIDFTDNGYERITCGLWGDTEGVLRWTRTGPTLPAGTVVTFAGDDGGATPALGTDFNIFVNGANDNTNWSIQSLNGDKNFNMNASDQIWMMQGGEWVQGSGSHDDSYTGKVLYGWTATDWKDTCNYASTSGSTIFPGSDCSSTNVTGVTNQDKVKYNGPMTITSTSGWLDRVNNSAYWVGFATSGAFDLGTPLYRTTDIDFPIGGLSSTGDTVYWQGGTDTDWFNCSNWSTRRVPDATKIVIFNTETGNTFNNIVLLAGETARCKELIVEGTTSGRSIKGEGSATAVLRIEQDITIGGPEALDFDDGNNATADGTIRLGGHWRNLSGQASFAEGNSTVVFQGTTAQNILPAAADGLEQFANLTLNNAAGLALGDSTSIAGTLTFTNGLLRTQGHLLTVSNTAPAAITGQGMSRYVVGTLRRHVAATGSYAFPIGTATRYELATVNLTSSSGLSYLDASFITPSGGAAPAYGLLLNAGHWSLVPDAGTLTASVTLTSRGHTNGSTTTTHHELASRTDDTDDWTAIASTGQSGTGTSAISVTGSPVTLAETELAIVRRMPKTWTGATSTAWAVGTNWTPVGAPTITDDAYIPLTTNKPIISAAGAECKDLFISENTGLELQAAGGLAVGGNLTLMSATDGAFTGSILDFGTLSVSGTIQVQRFMSGGNNGTLATGRSYHFSSPVAGATASVLGPLTGTSANRVHFWNEAQHQWTQVTNTADALQVGLGYVTRQWADNTLVFTGNFNTGAQSYTLARTSPGYKEGYNLIGNPYPSHVNIQAATRANLDETMWYYENGGFRTVNLTSAVGTPAGTTAQLPPLQSFWLRTTAGQASGTLSFDNSHRSISTQGFYKNGLSNQIFRLQAVANGHQQQAVVYFNTEAKLSLDRYDSEMWSSANPQKPEIFTTADGVRLVINGFPRPQEQTSVPLGLTVGVASEVSVSRFMVENFPSDAMVFLEDLHTGAMTDLGAGEVYTFQTAAMDNANRFLLHFFAPVVTESPEISGEPVRVHSFERTAYVLLPQNRGMAQVEVFNLLGSKVLDTRLSEGFHALPLSVVTGVYLVRVSQGGEVSSHKIWID